MPKTKARKIITVDCETDPFDKELREKNIFPAPFAWGVYDGEEYAQFWAEEKDEFGDDCPERVTEKFIQYLLEKYPDGANVYAHNGGKFDYFFMLKYFTGKPRIINGRISEAKLHANPKIKFYDSYNFIPVALGAIQKDEFDYTKMKKGIRNIHKNEILRYLQNDCVYLYDAIEKFINEFGKNLTISGASMKQLEKTGYAKPRTWDDHDSVFRKFYYGGRVQCFEVGAIEGELKFVDINSAYPYAMTFKHPYGAPINFGKKLPQNEKVVYFAKIKAIPKGCLPYKQKVDGVEKTFYPDDDEARIYYATSWEIRAGLRTGTLKVLEVFECHAYMEKKTKSLGEFVETFFKKKAEAKEAGDKTMELFYKLILNSCYGKFGQDGRKFEEVIIDDGETTFFKTFEEASQAMPQLENESDENYASRMSKHIYELYARNELGITLYTRPDPKEDFFDVAVASSITGFVRAYLFEHIFNCKRPIYCDTDSILCEEFNGVMGKKLGEWDLEATTTENYIVARKLYACKTTDEKKPYKIASKGVRLTFEDIKEGTLSEVPHIFHNDAPTFSLKRGKNYVSRKIDFSVVGKKLNPNPPKII